jgi:hypothetical protein
MLRVRTVLIDWDLQVLGPRVESGAIWLAVEWAGTFARRER